MPTSKPSPAQTPAQSPAPDDLGAIDLEGSGFEDQTPDSTQESEA